jgi:hypothetical protein
MRVPLFFGLLLLAVGAALPGCGPAVSKSDLGTIVTELPKVKGVEKPFEMKKLAPTKGQESDDDDMDRS